MGLRLIDYGLNDTDDDLANYLILSLQVDQVVPKTPASKNQSDFDIMDERIEAANCCLSDFRSDLHQNL